MTQQAQALLRRLHREVDEQQLEDLLADARAYLVGYTGREHLPAALLPVEVQLAAVNYHRYGAEGEAAHSEGGVSITFDMELNQIKDQLRRYRVGYVGLNRPAEPEQTGAPDEESGEAASIADAPASTDGGAAPTEAASAAPNGEAAA